MDSLTLGATPADETCVGVEYGIPLQRAECRLYREAIQHHYADRWQPGCSLIVRSNPHDFGVYLEVEVRFEESNDAQTDFAFNLESNVPTKWSDFRDAEEKRYAERHAEILAQRATDPDKWRRNP